MGRSVDLHGRSATDCYGHRRRRARDHGLKPEVEGRRMEEHPRDQAESPTLHHCGDPERWKEEVKHQKRVHIEGLPADGRSRGGCLTGDKMMTYGRLEEQTARK